ncbi:MAG: response regulator [Candidatus Omnitrophica bacterium]|nr:response regulator [Candidatus Omnitrophota bacterium]
MKKILVVDDDVNVVKLFQKRLESSGYAVISAADGEDGLRKVREVKPDLVLLDVMMPGMDGFSVVREIKSDPELKSIPVLIVTAKGDLGDIFRMEGVAGIFDKPLQGDEVFAKIRQLVG